MERRIWIVVFLFAFAANLAAQMEPCLTGADAPGCGIKVTMNPPVEAAGNVLSVPNQITVDVPQRLHATRVQLKSGPTGTEVADMFKPFAETKHFKKVDGVERFELDIKSCPGADNAFQFYVFTPKLPYPLTMNYQPFMCKPREGK